MPAITTSSWQTTTGQYTITYTITKNTDLNSNEQALLEYGIECSLSHIQDGPISSDSIRCISPDYETVYQIAQILRNHQVFPAHLHEIVTDLINCDSLKLKNIQCA